MAIAHQPTNYCPAFDAGRDLFQQAEVTDRFAKAILQNLGALAEST